MLVVCAEARGYLARVGFGKSSWSILGRSDFMLLSHVTGNTHALCEGHMTGREHPQALSYSTLCLSSSTCHLTAVGFWQHGGPERTLAGMLKLSDSGGCHGCHGNLRLRSHEAQRLMLVPENVLVYLHESHFHALLDGEAREVSSMSP